MSDTMATAANTIASAEAPRKRGHKYTADMTNAQRAAAVIIALGADKASKIYKHMEPEDVEQLTIEVAQMGFLDSEQTEEILTEYYQMCMTNKAITEGGLEYARMVLEKAYGEQEAADLLGKVTRSLKSRQFAFLNKADVKSLYTALQSERPQTVALVLSYVDAAKAAQIKALEVISGLTQEQAKQTLLNLSARYKSPERSFLSRTAPSRCRLMASTIAPQASSSKPHSERISGASAALASS